jgi:hypothetical protein
MKAEDLGRYGRAARRHLEYVWSFPPSAVDRLAIEAVVATAASDIDATEELLRRSLESERLRSHGSADLHWLCNAIPKLIQTLPTYVADLYVATLSYDEDSNEPTRLSASAILPLTSTRRQDIDMAKWTAVNHFPEFLRVAPTLAVAVLSRLIETEVQLGGVVQIRVGGRQVEVIADESTQWDRPSMRGNNDVLGLLDTFEEHLAQIDNDSEITELLTILGEDARPAVIWRRVLMAGVSSERIALHLMPLDHAVEDWATTDLLEPLGDLLRTRFATRSSDERERIELAVAALKPGEDDGSPAWYQEDQRHRLLLHALDAQGLTSGQSRSDQADTAPVRQDLTFDPQQDPIQERVARFGMRLDSDADRSVWPLIEAVQQFTDQYANTAPAEDDERASAAAVHALMQAPEWSTMSAMLRAFADGTVGRAAEIWTRRGGSSVGERGFAKSLLLGCCTHPLPQRTERDASPDLLTIPSGPRSDAARGLLQLGRFPDYMDVEIANAARTLAADEVPWVRHVVASNLQYLHSTDPDLMWGLLLQMAQSESHDGVLRAIANAAWSLRGDSSNAVEVVAITSARATRIDTPHSALEACTEIAGLWWVLEGDLRAHDLLTGLLDPQAHGTRGITAMLHEIRTAGALTSNDSETRIRALALCDELVDGALADLGDLDEVSSDVSDEREAQIRGAAEILDAVASQLYFASGASDQTNDGERAASAEGLRLAEEAAELVTKLGRVPIPRLTHHLVELLEYELDARPEAVTIALAEVVTSGGKRGGYQLDSMAVDLAVRIVQRLLADHRGILRNSACLTALREVLDVFVDAGWPQAHRLAYGLEHIFR